MKIIMISPFICGGVTAIIAQHLILRGYNFHDNTKPVRAVRVLFVITLILSAIAIIVELFKK
jgi:Na+-driven multidrug efflux pump